MSTKPIFPDLKWVCVYCNKRVPDDIEPELFKCCGEIGHVAQEIDIPELDEEDDVSKTE